MAFMLRPGQDAKTFVILKKYSTRSMAGSTGKSKDYQECGSLMGVLTSTSPSEREKWKQDGHEVTNKIVQYYGEIAKKGQYLKLENPVSGEPSLYFIETLKNPGELGHFTVYYVNKRDDLKYEQ